MTHVSCRRRWWTQEEDHTLKEEIKSQLEVGGQQGARNWSAIAQKLPGRSNKDCRKRWTKISLSSRKGTWSSAEDHLLRKAVAKFGLQWTKVAEMVGSRHPDQCAKRWHHSLDPNVKRGPWTTDEDRSLIEAVQRVGRDWKEIGRELFPSRSTTDIKNRYVILSRRQRLSPAATDLTNLLNSKNFTPMGILSSDIGPSSVTTPCNSGVFSLSTDLGMPLATDISSYIVDDASTISLSDVSQSDGGDSDPSTWSGPDWTAFDGQQLVLASQLRSDTLMHECTSREHPGHRGVGHPKHPRVRGPSTGSSDSGDQHVAQVKLKIWDEAV
ncbi:uncharacterized protein BDV14DRAFT_201680 [Aspergillus stella-maris]|uniref:uncharacterized protein n=1 Tax=Aspergillus stella-maris TaxID=1810926 RepID=UPI003CCD5336